MRKLIQWLDNRKELILTVLSGCVLIAITVAMLAHGSEVTERFVRACNAAGGVALDAQEPNRRQCIKGYGVPIKP